MSILQYQDVLLFLINSLTHTDSLLVDDTIPRTDTKSINVAMLSVHLKSLGASYITYVSMRQHPVLNLPQTIRLRRSGLPDQYSGISDS